MQFRLLHLLTVACAILLALKVGDVIDRRQSFAEAFLAEPVQAEEPAAPAEEKKGDAAAPAKEGEAAGAAASATPPAVPASGVSNFTRSELDILERLAQRHTKLREWQSDLEVKENVLNITQTKIDQKLDELRVLKKEVEGLLAEYNAKDDEKNRRLIKVYESMKPKDAASIFSELDPATQLLVAGKMKEAKLAFILAEMNTKQAKDLTTRLASHRKLVENGAMGVASAAVPTQ